MDPQPGDAVADRSPRVPQARVNPDGYVAQRFEHNLNDAGQWVLTYLNEGLVQVQLQILTDTDVVDWPELHLLHLRP